MSELPVFVLAVAALLSASNALVAQQPADKPSQRIIPRYLIRVTPRASDAYDIRVAPVPWILLAQPASGRQGYQLTVDDPLGTGAASEQEIICDQSVLKQACDGIREALRGVLPGYEDKRFNWVYPAASTDQAIRQQIHSIVNQPEFRKSLVEENIQELAKKVALLVNKEHIERIEKLAAEAAGLRKQVEDLRRVAATNGARQ